MAQKIVIEVPGTKISELERTSKVTAKDFFPVVQDDETKQAPLEQVANLVVAGLGSAALKNETDFASPASVDEVKVQSQKQVDAVNERIDGVERGLAAKQSGYFASYSTLEKANADIANIPLNVSVKVLSAEDGGDYFKESESSSNLTKAAYDPVFSSKKYTDEELGQKIDTQSADNYAAAFSDENNNIALGIRHDAVVHAPKFESQDINNTLINNIEHTTYIEAKTDEFGNIVAGITVDGIVHIPKLDFGNSSTEISNHHDYVEVKTDIYGNIVFAIKSDGSVDIPKLNIKFPAIQKLNRTLKIGSDDSIMHIGDSMTASHYVVQDKSYVSQLSQLSPFRHINYGVSGNDLLQMQQRVLNDTKTFGSSLKSMKPRFAFIASFANDWEFLSANHVYYQENTRRLIDLCLSHGVQPVLISYFNVSSTQHQCIKSIADEYQIPLIWNDVLNRQVGFYSKATLFHQAHTGTRNSGLWWIPMLEYIDQQKPMRTIKIYRKRTGFTVNSDDDLLFKGRIDKSKKWKEIGIGHYSFADESKYDELDTLAAEDRKWILHEDEYVKLANNQAVSFSDYALIEISLDVLQKDINNIDISLNISSGVLCFVRNNLDQATEIPRVKPDDPKYQQNWNKPRGKWRSVNFTDGKINIKKDDVVYSMIGNKIYLMLEGAFDLSFLTVTYLADQYESSSPTLNLAKQKLGIELLQQPLLGNVEQLAGWSVSGVVSPLVPIDVSNAPRKPDKNLPVDGVITLTPNNHIEQAVLFDSSEEIRTLKVVAWARYFPKAFFDITNPKYSTLDATQIEDRSKSNAMAQITKDTLDLREIQLETWTEEQQPVANGAIQLNYVALQWRPVEFFIEIQPYETQLSIRLNSKEGEIQLAKCSVKEVV